MSMNPGGIQNLEKSSIPAAARFFSPILSRFNTPTMDARLVAARLPGLAMYGSPYAGTSFPGYLPFGPSAAAAVAAAADTSPFYPTMASGEHSDVWRTGLSQAAAAAAYYDPNLAAHYAYSYGSMGLSDGARRKNATRETTSTLKAWLNDHRKNPYPTKGEKIMLAIITKMTLTQVSTWFANARRRLKKENKMTWSPRNRCGEDDDEDDDEMADGGHYSNETPNSRSSSPLLSSDLTPNNLPPRRLGESSCEGPSHSEPKEDHSRIPENSGVRSSDQLENKGISRQSSIDESKPRIASNPFSKHSYLYLNSPSSPSFGGLPVNLTSSTQTSGSRSGIPFPPPVSHFPGTSSLPGLPYPGVSGQFPSTAAAASLLAASRGHPLPPHIMAALSEQAQLQQYQQALQNLPVSTFMPVPSGPSSSSKVISSDHEQSHSPRSSSSRVTADSLQTTSKTSHPSNVLPHSKEKIWSIADVVTSNESTEIAANKKVPEASPQHFDTSLASHALVDEMLLRQKLTSSVTSPNKSQHIHNLATSFYGNTSSNQSSSLLSMVEKNTTDPDKESALKEQEDNSITGNQEISKRSPSKSCTTSRSMDSLGSNVFTSSPDPFHHHNDQTESDILQDA